MVRPSAERANLIRLSSRKRRRDQRPFPIGSSELANDTRSRSESNPTPTSQCRSKWVSQESLPKTGISGKSDGDLRLFLAKIAQIGRRETRTRSQKSPYLGPFCGFR